MAGQLSKDELPEVIEVHHLQKFLSISKNQAYNLANSGQFHTVRIGRLIKIPRESFLEWFVGCTRE
ncbi:helix-turn-helix domain-containing protein [Brevibacillus invocatus]|uniref:helix-turn-helix domain-containing protein n=1 Tax=Brevibacillus invocatus TaxID=173959 RepID=UPI002041A73E|nr:helix-turn-helix domain-containing protein [Brevibacillus invocatus]MCM3079595.1 helix-turn-helix domain-containing protein [Brevibacillus invocatus]MCM3429793.1 helix-turn-helix domain-containing protein [Brevibacillus invocatus]